MDTSEKYIKLCEKAQEIQESKIDFKNGDVFYLIFDIIRDTFNVKKYRGYADSKIGDITESGAKCISFNEETQMLEFEYFRKRKEDQVFVFSDNRNEFLDENSLCYEYSSDGISDSLNLKKIWLPRQDQLQEMLFFGNRTTLFIQQVQNFYEFYFKQSALKTSNGSMEIAWLAFVMKEKYNKLWNEEKQDWIINR